VVLVQAARAALVFTQVVQAARAAVLLLAGLEQLPCSLAAAAAAVLVRAVRTPSLRAEQSHSFLVQAAQRTRWACPQLQENRLAVQAAAVVRLIRLAATADSMEAAVVVVAKATPPLTATLAVREVQESYT
jgi:hypothetical protein